VFRRRKQSGPVLAPPYKRATTTDTGRWFEESLQRQMFQDALEQDETQIADCEARMRIPCGDGKPLHAQVVATDRALHARVTFGPGIHRLLRLQYDRVKYVEVSRPEETDVELTYFNPDRAVDETWHLRLEQTPAAPGFGATLAHLVSRRAAARTAAATRIAEATEAGHRATEQTWTVAAAAARATAPGAASAVASEVA
jgi:hypothetical protein